MTFSNFFLTGLKNTLKLKRGLNLSYTGTVVKIPEATVFDKWNVGDFSSADYKIVIEYGPNDIEHVNVTITARVNFASVLVYGRTNSGRDLVKFSATVNESAVSVIATPYNNSDTITPLVNIILTYKATYSERINTLQIPDITGRSDSLGGELGTYRNWYSNLPDNYIAVNEFGTVSITSISNIASPGQSTLSADFILTKLNFANSDNNLSFASSLSSLTFNISNYGSISVSNNFVISPAITSQINNITIGNTQRVSGTFTSLTSTDTTILNTSQNVSIAPTGTLTISPANTGDCDKMIIGANVPKTGKFSSITNNSNLILNGNQNISITGTNTVLISPVVGFIDNTIIGNTVPASGRFSSMTITQIANTGNSLIKQQQLTSILLGAGV
jgi:hypothetical protein